ncbi:MAG: antitoxin [Thermoanaerobaculia bacterium]
MRTTLDLDQDVLAAAKEIASSDKTTAGKVVSDLVRRALCAGPAASKVRNGFELLAGGGVPVTSQQIEGLLEDDY